MIHKYSILLLSTLFLFDMSKDPLEHHNWVDQMLDKLKELQNDYNTWNQGNIPGLWHDKYPENVLKNKKTREEAIKRVSAGGKTK